MSSATPTSWAVICPEHGRVFLTRDEYDSQMNNPDATWSCTRECGPPMAGICGEESEWDDDVYEANLERGDMEMAAAKEAPHA